MIEAHNPPFCQTAVMRSAVYNEDCIAVMKRYPDKFFNLAIVDPPYGNIDAIGLPETKKKGNPFRTQNWISRKNGRVERMVAISANGFGLCDVWD